MLYNRAILAAAAVLTMSLPAVGADKWQPAPSIQEEHAYEQRSRWDGFYLGLNGGYSFGDTRDASFDFNNMPGVAGAMDAEGWMGGGQIGYNAVFGRMLVGVEADIQGADINDTASNGFGTVSTDIDLFGTVRGRLGFVADRMLIYATAGYAWANVDVDLGVPGTTFTSSDTLNGYVVGGGIEYALSNNWSVKAEYNYVDLESVNVVGFDGGDRFATHVDPDFHAVRLGLNYRF